MTRRYPPNNILIILLPMVLYIVFILIFVAYSNFCIFYPSESVNPWLFVFILYPLLSGLLIYMVKKGKRRKRK